VVLPNVPKKEAAVLRRELNKLQKYLGGIKTMRRPPDIVLIVDQRREYNAILECQKLGLPDRVFVGYELRSRCSGYSRSG
jgi:ribosomal protein S2